MKTHPSFIGPCPPALSPSSPSSWTLSSGMPVSCICVVVGVESIYSFSIKWYHRRKATYLVWGMGTPNLKQGIGSGGKRGVEIKRSKRRTNKQRRGQEERIREGRDWGSAT